jgi:hypothetical protein
MWWKLMLALLCLIIFLLLISLGLIALIVLGEQAAPAYTGLTTDDACRVFALRGACR